MKNNSTKIVAVIGDPVSQSKSPIFQNAGFTAMGLDAHYQAIRVTTGELNSFFARLRSGEISGINVTVPHKQAVLNLVDEVTPLAKVIGAVNTVYTNNGKLIGDNTDAPGFLRALKEELKFNPRDKSVVPIGAGGAAHAVAHILVKEQIKKLTIVNRDVEKAQKLGREILRLAQDDKVSSTPVITVVDWYEIDPKFFENCDLLVNASSLGMGDNTWPTLDFVNWLPKTAVVSDVVYSPAKTPLVNAALQQGLIAKNGLAMLLYQGVIAFELFTGQKAPVEAMRQALKEIA